MATFLVVQKDKSIRIPSPFLASVTALVSYLGAIPLIFLDLYLFVFQNIYFRTYQIPLVDRKQFFVIDRYRLKKLNFGQKFNCFYCGYGRGVAAYGTAVIQQMEIHSCAIKHKVEPKGQLGTEEYYEYEDFE